MIWWCVISDWTCVRLLVMWACRVNGHTKLMWSVPVMVCSKIPSFCQFETKMDTQPLPGDNWLQLDWTKEVKSIISARKSLRQIFFFWCADASLCRLFGKGKQFYECTLRNFTTGKPPISMFYSCGIEM